jgi:hypothetical protein
LGTNFNDDKILVSFIYSCSATLWIFGRCSLQEFKQRSSCQEMLPIKAPNNCAVLFYFFMHDALQTIPHFYFPKKDLAKPHL